MVIRWPENTYAHAWIARYTYSWLPIVDFSGYTDTLVGSIHGGHGHTVSQNYAHHNLFHMGHSSAPNFPERTFYTYFRRSRATKCFLRNFPRALSYTWMGMSALEKCEHLSWSWCVSFWLSECSSVWITPIGLCLCKPGVKSLGRGI